MALLSSDRLTTMALAALEEVAAKCGHEAQRQTRGVALALAYLAYASGTRERSYFDGFWRFLKEPDGKVRDANVNACLNGIYIAVRRERLIEVMSAFGQEASRIFGPRTGYPAHPREPASRAE